MSTPALRVNGVKFGPNDATAYVTAYGATGNGSTDDTAAIQAAIAAATSGCTLVFPSGVYNISTALALSTANVRVIGYGAKIVQTGTLQRGINITGANSSVEGIWFYNNRGGADWINGTPTNAIGVSVVGAADVKIVNCKIENWGYAAIQTGTSPGLQIQGNRIIGIGAAGGLVGGSNTNLGVAGDGTGVGGEGIRIVNNRFSDLAQGVFTGNDWTDVQIVANEFTNIIGQHAMYLDDVLNLAITGNAINGTGRVGINVQLASNATRDGGNVSIIGNTIRNPGTNGITVIAGSAGLTFYHNGVVIADNTISGAGQDGISLDQVNDYSVVNNIIETTVRFGIVAAGNGNARNGRIAHNTVVATGNCPCYVVAQSSSYEVLIEANILRACNTATSGTTYENASMFVSAGVFGIRGNVVQAPGGSAAWNLYTDAGASYYMTGNTWSASLTNTLAGTLLQSPLDGPVTQTLFAVGAANTPGVTAANTTAAAAGAQQSSPMYVLEGRGWQTTGPASEKVQGAIQLLPIQSATHPAAEIDFMMAINGGAYAKYLTVNSAGDVSAPSGNARFLGGGLQRPSAGALNVGNDANSTSINLTNAAGGCPLNCGRGTVTQATSIVTGVTVNTASGVITTVSASTAAGATSSFIVTNSSVVAASSVQVTLGAYSGTFGTNGTPIVTVSAVGAGSFTVLIYNAHASAALAGTLKINFVAA